MKASIFIIVATAPFSFSFFKYLFNTNHTFYPKS